MLGWLLGRASCIRGEGAAGCWAAHQGCFLATERHGLVHAALEMLHCGSDPKDPAFGGIRDVLGPPFQEESPLCFRGGKSCIQKVSPCRFLTF